MRPRGAECGDRRAECRCSLRRRHESGEVIGAHDDEREVRAEQDRSTDLGREIPGCCAGHREHPDVNPVALAFQDLSKSVPDRVLGLLCTCPVGDGVTEDGEAD